MSTDTTAPTPARRRPVALASRADSAARRYRVRRLQPPSWADGPLTSCYLVLGASGLLLLIGLLMVFSASSIEAALAKEPVWAPGVQQVVWALLGLVALLLALRLPTGFLRRWIPLVLVFITLLLLLVLVPGIGMRINGARGWIRLGFASFQPSEVAKLVFALWGAHILALRDRYLTVRTLLVPVLPVFAVLSGLVILEPDFNGVVCLFLVLAGLLWAAGAPRRVWSILLAAAVTLGCALVAFFPYRAARITAFLHPFDDPTDGGFQAIRGFYALASGGLTGVGLGNSRMKWNLLPHAESDYIFAIIGEELGFLGCLVVVGLYGVLAWAGFRIARRSADRFVQLASVAITVWLVGQATLNMGYVVGLLPVTGVTLPLISAGGTSMVLTLFIVGLLARFARAEPAAIELARAQQRGRIARFLLPVPEHAIDPVRPRRAAPARPPAGRSTGRTGGSAPSGRAARTTGRTGHADRAASAPPRAARARPAATGSRVEPPGPHRPAGPADRGAPPVPRGRPRGSVPPGRNQPPGRRGAAPNRGDGR